LVRRHEAGESFADLGRAFSISKHAAKRRYRALVPYGALAPDGDIDFDKLRSLWTEGLSYRAIGVEMGVNADTINSWRERFGLPRRQAQQPPCNQPDRRWTDDEKATVIAHGYDLTAAGLARRLDGRSEQAVEALRNRLMHKGLIERPVKIAATVPTERKNSTRPRSEVTVAPKALKPARAAKPAKALKPAQAAKPAKLPQPTPSSKPVPARAPSLPQDPPPREWPAGTEAMIRCTWTQLKQIGEACGVVMRDMHDIDRLNKRRAELKMPPVYVRLTGWSAS